MNPRAYVGIGLLIAVILATVATVQFGIGRLPSRPAPITVNGTIGSEKANFLDDEKVKSILRDKYGVTVNYRSAGSISLVTEDLSNDDFLWPSSQFARDLFEQTHGKQAKSEIVFSSPIVMYAWKPVTDALREQGIVTQESGAYFLDLPKFVQVVEDGKTWKEIGVPSLSRRVVVYTTDPTKSNSGLLFAGLLATTLNNGDLPTEATIGAVLPKVQAFYARLGFLQESSGYLFEQFLVSGIGAYPIIVGYENQLVEYSLANPSARDVLNSQVSILYPRPNVWAAHTVISLNSKGDRLLEALKDPEIQKLAWEGHGFRTGVLGIQNDPKVLQVAGVATTVVESSPMPNAAVMEQIIAALGPSNRPQVTPSPSP
jgi:hypothetical protein